MLNWGLVEEPSVSIQQEIGKSQSKRRIKIGSYLTGYGWNCEKSS